MTNIDRIIKDLYKGVEEDNRSREKLASYTLDKKSDLGQGLSEVANLLRQAAAEDGE